MLNLAKTQIFGSVELPAQAAGLPSLFEGAALQKIVNTSTGIGEVTLTDSGTANAFSGILENVLRFPTISTNVEVDTVPATSPYTIVLQNLITATTQIGVFNASTNASYAYSASAPVAGTSFNTATVTNGQGYSVTQLTFAAGDAGVQLNVIYRRIVTAAQAALLFGDQYQRLASDATATVSVIQHGVIFTDAFDPTANFYAASPSLKSVAGGLISSVATGLGASTGTALPEGVQVHSVPTVDFPYLGIVIR
jgi:hypothetical protein